MQESTRLGQSMLMSVYRTKLVGKCRFITVTWCKNLLLHGLSVSIQEDRETDKKSNIYVKIELKPWSFWKKQGSKAFVLDEKSFGVVWDLKAAKFNGETVPRENYYVAIVSDQEVVFFLGDMKKDAYRRTGCRPCLVGPILVSKKEHVFGKRRYSTKVDIDHGKIKACFDVVIEFYDRDTEFDPEFEIRVDGKVVVHVKHLQWKFRGNETICFCDQKVEVFWDVHDWLFGSGPRNGLFVFKPVMSSKSKSDSLTLFSEEEVDSGSEEDGNTLVSSKFCFVLYAWKIE